MKYSKLKKLINRLANKRAEKLIEAAELRADKAEKYYLAKNARRQEAHDKKLAYIERMRVKAHERCHEMIEQTQKECENKLARARGYLITAKNIHDNTEAAHNGVNKAASSVQDAMMSAGKYYRLSEAEQAKAARLRNMEC